jgi:hypothetical protein
MSRFPGMDPYLEAPSLWPDFHEAFLFCIREALQPALPKKYYAQLRTREEVGIAGLSADRVIYPDVAVRTGGPADGGSAARQPDSASACEHLVIATVEPLQVGFLEVREVGTGGRLVTLIELVSPSNKRPGPDRDAFARKQEEIFQSTTHWVEIDLLRAGKRHGGHAQLHEHCKAKGYDYVVVVSRSSRRHPRLDLEVYGFTLAQPFPTIQVPLAPPDADVALDLGQVFQRAYDTGPYRKIIDYGVPPDQQGD